MPKSEVVHAALWVCLPTFYDDHFLTYQTVEEFYSEHSDFLGSIVTILL